MSIIQLLVKEMEQEVAIARKMLALVPNDKFDWKPHEKSMSMKQLAVHVAEIPGWPEYILNHEILDFAANPYESAAVSNREELLETLEKNYAAGKTVLEKSNDEVLVSKHWKMYMGETLLADYTKYEAIRHSFAQITHHRAQLGVYLRLLNIPIPGSYGPSADDPSF